MGKLRELINKTVKDPRGRITLAQSPNLPLLIFLVFSVLAIIFRHSSSTLLFKPLAFGAIFVWSWMEIFSGINYFRRILGIVVLLMSLSSAVLYLRSVG